MAKYTNFYETVKEAELRLRNTVILYDGKPYYLLRVTDHKNDGIFRAYLDEMGRKDGMATSRGLGVPYENYDEPGEVGPQMDEWLEKNPDSGIIRKMMNSPKFNRFRPFDLGNVNTNGGVLYTERAPTRHTQQGLTAQMVSATSVSCLPSEAPSGPARFRSSVDIFSRSFCKTIVGEFPSAGDCLSALVDPNNVNSAVAFDRKFSLVKGPIGMLFLGYKESIVGVLPNNDFSRVRLDPKFSFIREVVQELNIFDDITV